MRIERTEEFLSAVLASLPGGQAPVNRRGSSPHFDIVKDFHEQSNRVLKSTQEMDRLVQKNFGAYIAMAQHSMLTNSTKPALAREGREELDAAIEQYCLTSNAQLKLVTSLAKQCASSRTTKSQVKHTKEVVSLLTSRYKNVVSKIHNMKKLFALEASKNEEGIRLGVEKPETEKAWSKQKKGLSVPVAFGDQSLGEDERAALEMENRMMFAELENVSDEAVKLEKKMEDITAIAKLFGDQIYEQHEMLEKIGDNVDGSKRNIVSGNKHLIRAEENTGKGSRFLVYVLIIHSFVLLFLDFYYK